MKLVDRQLQTAVAAFLTEPWRTEYKYLYNKLHWRLSKLPLYNELHRVVLDRFCFLYAKCHQLEAEQRVEKQYGAAYWAAMRGMKNELHSLIKLCEVPQSREALVEQRLQDMEKIIDRQVLAVIIKVFMEIESSEEKKNLFLDRLKVLFTAEASPKARRWKNYVSDFRQGCKVAHLSKIYQYVPG